MQGNESVHQDRLLHRANPMIQITPAQAKERKLQSITIDIDPIVEDWIVEKINNDMKGCNAAWIVMPNGKLQCVRHVGELNTINEYNYYPYGN
jgi:hypothetical protein